MVNPTRRSMLVGVAATAALHGGALRAAPAGRRFPPGFLWGAAGAGHQVEGNNVNSDVWLLENVRPSMFAERSGDACNSFALWPTDLEIARRAGLDSFRFSLEWSRIEPEPGVFSIAMLDHYKAIVEGCRARGLTPMVTFNHFATPRWFAAAGGWTAPDSPALFARYCDRASRHLAGGIGYATTLNEPNTINIIGDVFPPQHLDVMRRMNAAAAKASGTAAFANAMIPDPADLAKIQPNLMAAHTAAKAAIKAARGDLPVGVGLAISDDQGEPALRDEKRRLYYGEWLDLARADDYVGVQNYERAVHTTGPSVPPAPGVPLNGYGREIYAPSLANAVRYAHSVARVPVLVTEHGVNTMDDAVRARFIGAALADLAGVIADGVPVKGYVHWSLLDNFEWIFGYKPSFGLCAVDRVTFARTPKPSLALLGRIASRNSL